MSFENHADQSAKNDDLTGTPADQPTTDFSAEAPTTQLGIPRELQTEPAEQSAVFETEQPAVSPTISPTVSQPEAPTAMLTNPATEQISPVSRQMELPASSAPSAVPVAEQINPVAMETELPVTPATEQNNPVRTQPEPSVFTNPVAGEVNATQSPMMNANSQNTSTANESFGPAYATETVGHFSGNSTGQAQFYSSMPPAGSSTGSPYLAGNGLPVGISGPGVSASVSKPQRKIKRGPGWLATIAIAVVVALSCLYLPSLWQGSGLSPNSGASIATQAPVKQASPDQTNWEEVAKAVQPAVVTIQVAEGNGQGESGSGVIFDDQGHIITNDHVISGARKGGKVTIQTSNGRVYDGKVLGSDPTTDLAVVAFVNTPQEKVTMAHLGDSSKLKVAQPVAAIGAPLGLTNTVTTGIVSALNRPVTVSAMSDQSSAGNPIVTNAVQVDAAINPGNSGGPLFDAQGSVIGINSSIASLPTERIAGGQSGSIGIGFAIPVNLAKSVANQILTKGKVTHAQLGVTVTPAIAKLSNNNGAVTGALINSVLAGTGAADAGLKPNQLITKIDEHTVSSGTALIGFVRWYLPGDTVTLTVQDQEGEHKIKVTLKAEK